MSEKIKPTLPFINARPSTQLSAWVITLAFSLWSLGCDRMPHAEHPTKAPIWQGEPHWQLSHGNARPDEYAFLETLAHRDDPAWRKGLALESDSLKAWLDPRFQRVSAIHDALSSAHDRAWAASNKSIARADAQLTTLPNQTKKIYAQRFREGEQHPIYTREVPGLDQPPEIVLDVNRLAMGLPIYRLINWVENPTRNLIALVEDTSGQGLLRLRFTEPGATSSSIGVTIEHAGPDVVWLSHTDVAYTAIDPETFRPFAVKSHRLGTSHGSDRTIFEAKNPSDVVTLSKSLRGGEAWIKIEGQGSTEIQRLSFDSTHPQSNLCLPREPGTRYRLGTTGTQIGLGILRDGQNETDEFAIWRAQPFPCPPEKPRGLALAANQSLEDFEVFADVSLLLVREGQTMQPILVTHGSALQAMPIPLPARWAKQPAIDLRMGRRSSSNNAISLFISAPGSSESRLMFDAETGQMIEPLDAGPFSSRAGFKVDTWSTNSFDGTPIPITLVLPEPSTALNLEAKAPVPVWVTAYGSYGKNLSIGHDPLVDVLLETGVAVAYAHVRGGRELGGAWHEAGRGSKKVNAVQDLIAAARAIGRHPSIDAARMLGFGQSAGGAVIAAAVNAAPELFLGIILDRPFLDPLLALENERSPLTTTNYFEFGDPHSRDGYQSILAWSPYDQVRAQAYPNTWLKGFKHDQRTKATGLIKWAARVRQLATNRPEILIDLAEGGGHFGSYNATERRRSDAAMLAFAFELLGFDDTTLPSLNRM